MNKEEIFKKAIQMKKPLSEEFQSLGTKWYTEKGQVLDYSEFSFIKLKESGMSDGQITIASALIDLAIGFGRLQLFAEVTEILNETQKYIIPFRKPPQASG